MFVLGILIGLAMGFFMGAVSYFCFMERKVKKFPKYDFERMLQRIKESKLKGGKV